MTTRPAGTQPTATGETVTAGDIARLAGVGRAAVSNWRRRFPDFPTPVGGASSSLRYALGHVEQWLTTHGKPFRIGAADRLWHRIRGTADDPALGAHVHHVGVLLLHLRDGPPRPLPQRLRTVDGTPADPQLPRLAAAALAEQSAAELFEYLYQRYAEACSRWLPVVPDGVAALMAQLAEASGARVLDPACGTGALLTAAHEAGARQLLGCDADDDQAGIARVRLLLRDVPAEIVTGDALRSSPPPGTAVDAVVSAPPAESAWEYDELIDDPRWAHGLPPRSEAALAWLQHCLHVVRPGGDVVLLLPAAVASRRAGRRIRANLLRDGVVRAVFALPATDAGLSVGHLWVLRRHAPGGSPPDAVLLRVLDTLAVTAEWRAFCDGATDLPGAVRVVELLDETVNLDPVHRANLDDIPDSVTFFSDARVQFAHVAGSLAGSMPDLDIGERPAHTATVGVDDLIRRGVLALHQPPLRMTVGDGPLAVLTLNDLRRGRAATGRASDLPGLVPIRAGDVLVGADGPRLAVRLADEPGAVLGPQLLLLRVDPDRLDPYFLAGQLRAGGLVNEPASRSRPSGATRTGLRRLRLPRLPVAEQRRHGEAFRRLLEAERLLRDTNRIAHEVLDGGFRGLADGTLRPEGR